MLDSATQGRLVGRPGAPFVTKLRCIFWGVPHAAKNYYAFFMRPSKSLKVLWANAQPAPTQPAPAPSAGAAAGAGATAAAAAAHVLELSMQAQQQSLQAQSRGAAAAVEGAGWWVKKVGQAGGAKAPREAQRGNGLAQCAPGCGLFRCMSKIQLIPKKQQQTYEQQQQQQRKCLHEERPV
eukprot:1156924-Pelagomonas_calceolata.AAC.7